MRTEWAVSVFAILLSHMIAGGEAAGEEAAESSERDEEAFAEAQRLFQQGLRLFEVEDWEAAIERFDESLRLLPTAVARFNRAVCLERLGRTIEAVAALREYLERHATEVSEDRHAAVEEEIDRLEGLLARIVVRVDRPESAEVVLDGDIVVRTPLATPLVVNAGSHTVEIRAAGFDPLRRELSLAPGGETEIVVELHPEGSAGSVLIEVAVPGATVTIDGEIVGETPLADPLVTPPGHHIVEATRPGYEQARTEIDVEDRGVVRLELQLTPLSNLPAELSGALDLSVSEDGATVAIDGQLFQEGPLPVGRHRVDVSRDGFEPWSQEVEVATGAPTPVEVELVPTATFREHHESRARRFRIAAYVTGGLGIAALATTLGLFVWNGNRYDDWGAENLRIENGEYTGDAHNRAVQENNELGDSIDTIKIVSWVFLGTGVAALATAFGLFFGGPRPNRYRAVSFLPGPGGFAFTVRWGTM